MRPLASLHRRIRELGFHCSLRLIQRLDRWRLRRLARAHPGLSIDPTASSNFGCACIELAAGARLRIGAGVDTDRLPGQLELRVGPGALVEIGDGSWLRTDSQKIRIAALEGASIVLGRNCWLNGCQLSANASIVAEQGAMIGPGVRIYDSNHALDESTPARARKVRIGEFTWIASDVTVLQGVEIGSHSVIGARSVVTRSLPSHTLAYGIPATPHGEVGKRHAFM